MTGPASQPRKPVILTVDDDPAVSRAVARDLRRHYGERYRIVRAEIGPDALATLKELKLRGDTVAVLVADYRMPQMSGIEFLEKAMDLFPLAQAGAADRLRRHPRRHRRHQRRRPRPLPAQAVGSARGEALPRHRRAARGVARRRRPGDAVHQGHRPPLEPAVVGGAPVPGPQPVPVPRLHGRRAQGQAAARGRRPRRPAAARGDHREGRGHRRADRRPSWPSCSGCRPNRRCRCTTSPSSAAAPPGSASAVYGASEGLETVLIERTTTGGQAGRSSRIENYLGFPIGVSGAELTNSARRQAERFGAEVITTRDVVKLHVGEVGADHRVRGRQHHRRPFGDPRDRRRVPGAARSSAAGATPTIPTAATTSAAASTTAPRCPTPRSAATRTSTSSAAPTRRARPRCSCPRPPSR